MASSKAGLAFCLGMFYLLVLETELGIAINLESMCSSLNLIICLGNKYKFEFLFLEMNVAKVQCPGADCICN